MEGVYGWVRNIVYYLIFMTIITNLLPAGKYEKYLRLFAGCILILLVMQPMTGGLRLEEKIGAIFRAVSFENEAGELKGEMDEMEKKRLEHLISEYERTAADELIRMAGEEGIEAVEASVVIEGDASSRDFGKVIKIALKVKNEGSAPAGGRPEKKEEDTPQRIVLEDVEKVSDQLDERGGGRADEESAVNASEADGGKSRGIEAAGRVMEQEGQQLQENEALKDFRRTIAGYYRMEEQNVEIRLEN